ncbi:MAG TPA: xanthine dehydrogenase family protein subunit M, partial [Micromonosporaceae bacterium]
RDRQSYEFALVSSFAAVSVADGRIEDVRLALGGVGTVPWRARRAEAALRGAPATPQSFAGAADDEMTAAVTREHNAFKVEFAKRVIRRGLAEATGGGMP